MATVSEYCTAISDSPCSTPTMPSHANTPQQHVVDGHDTASSPAFRGLQQPFADGEHVSTQHRERQPAKQYTPEVQQGVMHGPVSVQQVPQQGTEQCTTAVQPRLSLQTSGAQAAGRQRYRPRPRWRGYLPLIGRKPITQQQTSSGTKAANGLNQLDCGLEGGLSGATHGTAAAPRHIHMRVDGVAQDDPGVVNTCLHSPGTPSAVCPNKGVASAGHPPAQHQQLPADIPHPDNNTATASSASELTGHNVATPVPALGNIHIQLESTHSGWDHVPPGSTGCTSAQPQAPNVARSSRGGAQELQKDAHRAVVSHDVETLVTQIDAEHLEEPRLQVGDGTGVGGCLPGDDSGVGTPVAEAVVVRRGPGRPRKGTQVAKRAVEEECADPPARNLRRRKGEGTAEGLHALVGVQNRQEPADIASANGRRAASALLVPSTQHQPLVSLIPESSGGAVALQDGLVLVGSDMDATAGHTRDVAVGDVASAPESAEPRDSTRLPEVANPVRRGRGRPRKSQRLASTRAAGEYESNNPSHRVLRVGTGGPPLSATQAAAATTQRPAPVDTSPRKRGRPPKTARPMAAPRKRGRPPKTARPMTALRKRGRPPKTAAPVVVPITQHSKLVRQSLHNARKRGRPRKHPAVVDNARLVPSVASQLARDVEVRRNNPHTALPSSRAAAQRYISLVEVLEKDGMGVAEGCAKGCTQRGRDRRKVVGASKPRQVGRLAVQAVAGRRAVHERPGRSTGPLAKHPFFALSRLHSKDQKRYRAVLRRLGYDATIKNDGHGWDSHVTHVVCPDLARCPKTLAGMAVGCWIVSTTYLDACAAAGKLLEPAEHELSSASSGLIDEGAPAWWREHAAEHGPAFKGLRVHVDDIPDIDALKSERLVQILEAGGATVSTSIGAAKRGATDLAVIATSTSPSAPHVRQMMRAGVVCVEPWFVVDWLARPTACLPTRYMLPAPLAEKVQLLRSCGAAAT